MAPRTAKTKVFVNVYDLVETNKCTSVVGLGVYHSGVEIGGDEYTFAGGAGIFSATPKEVDGAIFRESIELGVFEGSRADAQHIINSMKDEYPGDSYDIIMRNCNTFANDACLRLIGVPIPAYINRLAYFGSFIRSLLPAKLNGSPNDSTGIEQQKKNDRHVPSFTGNGVKLGGNADQTAESITDRREKLRQAALRRFQQQEESN